MDTGRIFPGIGLIAFTVAMGVNPACAAGCDASSTVGSGNHHTAGCAGIASLLQGPGYTAQPGAPASCGRSPGMPP